MTGCVAQVAFDFAAKVDDHLVSGRLKGGYRPREIRIVLSDIPPPLFEKKAILGLHFDVEETESGLEPHAAGMHDISLTSPSSIGAACVSGGCSSPHISSFAAEPFTG